MEKKKNFIQVVKFGIIGVLNTLIDFVVFYVLVAVTPIYKEIAQVISTLLGMTNSYFMNRYFTFEKKGALSVSEMGKFAVVNGVSLGVNILFLYLFYDVLHAEVLGNGILNAAGIGFVLEGADAKLFAKVLAAPFALTVNFLGNKFWVFKSKEKDENK